MEEPAHHYKPPTNNTGWVDFVSTPIVGLGWTVAEDADSQSHHVQFSRV
jgi:hypothetical protein